jgi:phage shock protein A
MFGTLKTLMQGTNARAEERVRAAYAMELIDQKIRESGDGLRLAKATLASLIQRQRAEERQLAALAARTADLIARAQQALTAGRDDLATEAAEAIAVMENELTLRRDTQARLEARALRMQTSVETATRRFIDLRQGAIAARAVRDEHALQARINTTLSSPSPMAEAEELIAGVLGRDDPFEQTEILTEIDRGLNHDTIADKLADQGFGRALKSTTADVHARLKAQA